MIKLLENQLIDTIGSQDTERWTTPLLYDYGVVQCFGTFDGATVTLEYADSAELEWIEAGEFTTFTNSGGGRFYLPTGVLLRGTVSNAGGTTNITLGLL